MATWICGTSRPSSGPSEAASSDRRHRCSRCCRSFPPPPSAIRDDPVAYAPMDGPTPVSLHSSRPAPRRDLAAIRRLAIIVLTTAVLLAFCGTLWNDFVAWDDDYLLQRNDRYRG